jgi:small subunit ribosomal protein S16
VAVRVRLTRVGSRKNPIWRVVVADQRSPRDGRILETVGRYNPQRQPSEIVLDRERIEHWVGHGAQVSDTVRSLMRATEREAPPERAAAGASRARGGRAADRKAGTAEAAAEEAADAEAPPEEAPAEEAAEATAEEAPEAPAEEDPSVADAAPAEDEGEVDEEASESATAAGGG